MDEQMSLFDLSEVEEAKPAPTAKAKKEKDFGAAQTSLFSFAFPRFRFTKPIRMIELFAGYGSQKLAMEYLQRDGALKLPCETWRICEWAIPSFIAYKAIHKPDDHKDYSEGLSKDEIAAALFERGASLDWNKPATLAELKRRPEAYLRLAYNSMASVGNMVDVSRVRGKDLAMRERERYQVLLSYSFPCQDLSLAGERKMMDEGSGTRSSLLWEVKRILKEMADEGQKPDCLLMENVPQVASADNRKNMEKWQAFLSSLGYRSYGQCVMATEHGVPQTRNRYFLISVLGDYSYDFPPPYALDVKLKDVLEPKVEDRFYLSEKNIKNILNWKGRNPLEEGAMFEDGVSGTIIAKPQSSTSRQTKLLLSPIDKAQKIGSYTHAGIGGDVFKEGGCCSTLTTGNHGNVTALAIGCHAVTNGHGKIDKGSDDHKIVLESNKKEASYSLTTLASMSGLVAIHSEFGKTQTSESEAMTISATEADGNEAKLGLIQVDGVWYVVRKFTPRECFRLMGVRDEDYDRIKDLLPESAQYHLAGDSIVCGPTKDRGVLTGIFGAMI